MGQQGAPAEAVARRSGARLTSRPRQVEASAGGRRRAGAGAAEAGGASNGVWWFGRSREPQQGTGSGGHARPWAHAGARVRGRGTDEARGSASGAGDNRQWWREGVAGRQRWSARAAALAEQSRGAGLGRTSRGGPARLRGGEREAR
nr:uncharacterized protein LOC120964682 [Aegilops tauschii subsp. strangulata]